MFCIELGYIIDLTESSKAYGMALFLHIPYIIKMIFGAILAGGVGSRMNIADMPKQFLPLGDKPIIIHTLEKFMLCSKMDKIYIGVHPSWLLHMEDLIEKFIEWYNKENQEETVAEDWDFEKESDKVHVTSKEYNEEYDIYDDYDSAKEWSLKTGEKIYVSINNQKYVEIE